MIMAWAYCLIYIQIHKSYYPTTLQMISSLAHEKKAAPVIIMTWTADFEITIRYEGHEWGEVVQLCSQASFRKSRR